LAIYIHWPFCRSKCPYCDFNSHVVEGVDHGRWAAALLRELDHFAEQTRGRAVGRVFFGGGTPSLMDPDTVHALIAAIRRHWPAEPDLEITLEANPTSSEAARFAAFKAAGVNRLSVGVQSLDDAALAFLGRTHSAAEARTTVTRARACFDRFSFDLIYGLPGQTRAHWRHQLGEALAMAGDHLSVYQLTIEPGTAFYRQGVAAADAESGADLYEITRDVLGAGNLPAYEISNHAAAGGECRHNLNIWRGGDYVGIGPGAHGRLTRDGRTEAVRQLGAPEKWLTAVEARGHATASRAPVAARERMEELLLVGMRLTEGIDARRFLELTGAPLADVVDPRGLDQLVNGGFVEFTPQHLRATPAGLQRLNAVLERLLA
jgi:oxygen-independent coproporphyrinogen-3 oxidase